MKRGWMVMVSVGLANVAWAQLAPPRHPVDPGSPQSAALASQAAEDLVRGRAGDALQVANDAINADPRNPWGHYNKASALASLGRVDDAVAEFRVAQNAFGTGDAWGKSVAIYGRANALAQAGRCNEAQPAFEEYAAFVEPTDARSAALARGTARACVPRR
jgi:tetratricopeptide (TPR) repeat protein